MTTDELKAFVKSHEVWFRGRLPETDSSLAEAEQLLGVPLPRSLRWLLTEYGYWHGTAVSNLDDSVRDTLSAREHLGLPTRFIVLENLQDGGVVLVDTEEQPTPGEPVVYWAGLEDLGAAPKLEGNRRYISFGEYVAERLAHQQDLFNPEDVPYDPRSFPEGRDI